MSEQYHPTCAFGFSPINGKQKLHQLWVGEGGSLSWRPVPYIKVKADRKPVIAGYVPEDEEDAENS